MDFELALLDPSLYTANGWMKDTAKKVSHSIKKGAEHVGDFVVNNAPKVIESAAKAGLKTFLDTGSISAAVTMAIKAAAKKGVDISKAEAEKILSNEYNKAANTHMTHADFIGFAGSIQDHHKLLEERGLHTRSSHKHHAPPKPRHQDVLDELLSDSDSDY